MLDAKVVGLGFDFEVVVRPYLHELLDRIPTFLFKYAFILPKTDGF